MPPKDLGKATLAGGMLNLTVGPSDTPFDVHLELLCDCSPYFNDRLADRFHNPLTEELRFPNDDPGAFADFILWAYTGTLDISVNNDSGNGNGNCSSKDGNSSGAEPDLILHLFRVWTLAARFLVPQLRQLAMSRCEVEMNVDPERLASCSAVRFAYMESTRPPPPTTTTSTSMATSTLRKFVIGVWAQGAGRRTLSDLTHELPGEFVRDVNNAVTSGRKDTPRFDRDRTPTQKDLGIKEPARMAAPQVLAHRPRMGHPTRRRTTVHILLACMH
ncbi:hypothetical protein ASPCAL04264 [Aspergillus calidoustus]|uniref:BTB domain-containing protein n=1 Tax=Aspergillus calidoustus TaxID=454130 RepID=A0A0U5FUW1_ASPCI|nr:hypothetical protein ASPCAL04264 [Aspergillus calidoustus]